MTSFFSYWWHEFINFTLLGAAILLYIKKNLILNKDLRLIGIFLIINLSIEIIATYFTSQRKNNLHLYHFLSLFQTIILYFQFRIMISYNYIKLCNILFVTVALAMLVYLFKVGSFLVYPSVLVVLRNIFFCAMSLIYFRSLIADENIVELHRHSLFWFAAGILVYSFSGIIIEGLMHYLIAEKRHIANYLFNFWVFTNYLLYVFILISFSHVKSWKI
jgi:hypothetical protein